MVNCHLSSAAGGRGLSHFYHGLLGTEASAPPRADASVPNCPTCGILDRFRTGRKTGMNDTVYHNTRQIKHWHNHATERLS